MVLPLSHLYEFGFVYFKLTVDSCFVDVGMNKRRRSSETKSSKKERDSSHKKHNTQGKPEERRKHKHHKHDRREISNFKELSDADYFSKNNEFATWLKDERDIFFSDLSSDSARKLFTKFVKDWNNKKLDSKYYDGIETGPRSSHNWKIKSDTKAVLCSVTPAAAHSPTLLLLNLMLLLWSSPLPPLLPPQLLPLPLPTITAAPPYATVTGTAVAPTV
ncbi:hypothetical protein R6Q59_031359 [Mikania micrantha]